MIVLDHTATGTLRSTYNTAGSSSTFPVGSVHQLRAKNKELKEEQKLLNWKVNILMDMVSVSSVYVVFV